MVAPLVIFAFNRPDLLRRMLTALAENSLAADSPLTVFCDGPRHEKDEPGTRAVRQLARAAKGFLSVEVVERPTNMGCAASVIDGLTRMFSLHERLIVMEDDILTSPHTLRFLNEGLARYAGNEKIFNISAWSPPHVARAVPAGYPYDVYAIPRFNCWGWASWRDRFINIDWSVSDYGTFKRSPHLCTAFNAGGENLRACWTRRCREKSKAGLFAPVMRASKTICWASIRCARIRAISAWGAGRTQRQSQPTGMATFLLHQRLSVFPKSSMWTSVSEKCITTAMTEKNARFPNACSAASVACCGSTL